MRQATQQSFQRGRDRILGGVCSGLAAGLHLDPLWVRLGFVLLAFLQGVGLLIYIVLWLVMPEQVEGQEGSRSGFDSMTADLKRIGGELRSQFGGTRTQAPPPEQTSDPLVASTTPSPPVTTPATTSGRQSLALGVLLVAVGLILLGANTGLIQWSVIWPSLIIILGILLLARTFDRKR